MEYKKEQQKRYYWLRLKDDFFTQKVIKKLRRTENGDKKVIIYLELMLLSIKQDCTLFYDGVEETLEEELALDLDEDSKLIKDTIDFLIKYGLIEVKEDNYFLPEAKACIGSESYSAERVRRYRDKNKTLQCNTDVIQSNMIVTDCNEEKENRDRYIDKDIKEIDKEKENKCSKPQKHKYGEYNHVLLTDPEKEKLILEYGQIFFDKCIKKLDEYIEMKGYKSKNHNLVIRKWVIEAIKQDDLKINKNGGTKAYGEKYDTKNSSSTEYYKQFM